MGVNPLRSRQRTPSPTPALAIWWAGPAIGLLNLIPVLPLDGGHIAQTGLEAVLRRPALREMAIASLVLTIAAAVAMAVLGRTGFVIFVAFLLIGQIAARAGDVDQAPAGRRAAPIGDAEARSGSCAAAGAAPSPWQLAYQALLAGDPDAPGG